MLLPISSARPVVVALRRVPVCSYTSSSLFAGSCIRCLVLWGLAEDNHEDLSRAQPYVEVFVVLPWLLPVPTALHCGAWLLRNRLVR